MSSSDAAIFDAEEQPISTGAERATGGGGGGSSPRTTRSSSEVSLGVLGIILAAVSLCMFGVYASTTSMFDKSEIYKAYQSKYTNDADIVGREIMLFGDSLVGVSNEKYDMGKELEKDVKLKKSDFDITIAISAESGDKARDLYVRVEEDVIHRKSKESAPDAIIVLFDSDAADVWEGDKSVEIRQDYEDKLDGLVSKLTDAIDYVALSGPILDGEKKDGLNEKDSQLDAYEAINKKIAKRHNLDYISLRELFQQSEDGYDEDQGHLTMDGERPKKGGESIIEAAFLKQITGSSWDGLWKGAKTRLINYHAPAYLESKIDHIEATAKHKACVEANGASACADLEKQAQEKLAVHLDVVDQHFPSGKNVPNADSSHKDATIEEAEDITADKAKITSIKTGQSEPDVVASESKLNVVSPKKKSATKSFSKNSKKSGKSKKSKKSKR